jgi:hypothetical protein
LGPNNPNLYKRIVLFARRRRIQVCLPLLLKIKRKPLQQNRKIKKKKWRTKRRNRESLETIRIKTVSSIDLIDAYKYTCLPYQLDWNMKIINILYFIISIQSPNNNSRQIINADITHISILEIRHDFYKAKCMIYFNN